VSAAFALSPGAAGATYYQNLVEAATAAERYFGGGMRPAHQVVLHLVTRGTTDRPGETGTLVEVRCMGTFIGYLAERQL
jgi:hypothetical protein